jgi:hypothetical protein
MRRHSLVGPWPEVLAQRVAVGGPAAYTCGVVGVFGQPRFHTGALAIRQFAIDPGAECFVADAKATKRTLRA